MTTKELNRDIKRLNELIKALPDTDITAYYKAIENIFKPEFIRLYNADNSLKSLNADSLRILIRLNLRFRFIAFHHFGLNIEL